MNKINNYNESIKYSLMNTLLGLNYILNKNFNFQNGLYNINDISKIDLKDLYNNFKKFLNDSNIDKNESLINNSKNYINFKDDLRLHLPFLHIDREINFETIDKTIFNFIDPKINIKSGKNFDNHTISSSYNDKGSYLSFSDNKNEKRKIDMYLCDGYLHSTKFTGLKTRDWKIYECKENGDLLIMSKQRLRIRWILDLFLNKNSKEPILEVKTKIRNCKGEYTPCINNKLQQLNIELSNFDKKSQILKLVFEKYENCYSVYNNNYIPQTPIYLKMKINTNKNLPIFDENKLMQNGVDLNSENGKIIWYETDYCGNAKYMRENYNPLINVSTEYLSYEEIEREYDNESYIFLKKYALGKSYDIRKKSVINIDNLCSYLDMAYFENYLKTESLIDSYNIKKLYTLLYDAGPMTIHLPIPQNNKLSLISLVKNREKLLGFGDSDYKNGTNFFHIFSEYMYIHPNLLKYEGYDINPPEGLINILQMKFKVIGKLPMFTLDISKNISNEILFISKNNKRKYSGLKVLENTDKIIVKHSYCMYVHFNEYNPNWDELTINDSVKFEDYYGNYIISDGCYFNNNLIKLGNVIEYKYGICPNNELDLSEICFNLFKRIILNEEINFFNSEDNKECISITSKSKNFKDCLVYPIMYKNNIFDEYIYKTDVSSEYYKNSYENILNNNIDPKFINEGENKNDINYNNFLKKIDINEKLLYLWNPHLWKGNIEQEFNIYFKPKKDYNGYYNLKWNINRYLNYVGTLNYKFKIIDNTKNKKKVKNFIKYNIIFDKFRNNEKNLKYEIESLNNNNIISNLPFNKLKFEFLTKIEKPNILFNTISEKNYYPLIESIKNTDTNLNKVKIYSTNNIEKIYSFNKKIFVKTNGTICFDNNINRLCDIKTLNNLQLIEELTNKIFYINFSSKLDKYNDYYVIEKVLFFNEDNDYFNSEKIDGFMIRKILNENYLNYTQLKYLNKNIKSWPLLDSSNSIELSEPIRVKFPQEINLKKINIIHDIYQNIYKTEIIIPNWNNLNIENVDFQNIIFYTAYLERNYIQKWEILLNNKKIIDKHSLEDYDNCNFEFKKFFNDNYEIFMECINFKKEYYNKEYYNKEYYKNNLNNKINIAFKLENIYDNPPVESNFIYEKELIEKTEFKNIDYISDNEIELSVNNHLSELNNILKNSHLSKYNILNELNNPKFTWDSSYKYLEEYNNFLKKKYSNVKNNIPEVSYSRSEKIVEEPIMLIKNNGTIMNLDNNDWQLQEFDKIRLVIEQCSDYPVLEPILKQYPQNNNFIYNDIYPIAIENPYIATDLNIIDVHFVNNIYYNNIYEKEPPEYITYAENTSNYGIYVKLNYDNFLNINKYEPNKLNKIDYHNNKIIKSKNGKYIYYNFNDKYFIEGDGEVWYDEKIKKYKIYNNGLSEEVPLIYNKYGKSRNNILNLEDDCIITDGNIYYFLKNKFNFGEPEFYITNNNNFTSDFHNTENIITDSVKLVINKNLINILGSINNRWSIYIDFLTNADNFKKIHPYANSNIEKTRTESNSKIVNINDVKKSIPLFYYNQIIDIFHNQGNIGHLLLRLIKNKRVKKTKYLLTDINKMNFEIISDLRINIKNSDKWFLRHLRKGEYYGTNKKGDIRIYPEQLNDILQEDYNNKCLLYYPSWGNYIEKLINKKNTGYPYYNSYNIEYSDILDKYKKLIQLVTMSKSEDNNKNYKNLMKLVKLILKKNIQNGNKLYISKGPGNLENFTLKKKITSQTVHNLHNQIDNILFKLNK